MAASFRPLRLRKVYSLRVPTALLASAVFMAKPALPLVAALIVLCSSPVMAQQAGDPVTRFIKGLFGSDPAPAATPPAPAPPAEPKPAAAAPVARKHAPVAAQNPAVDGATAPASPKAAEKSGSAPAARGPAAHGAPPRQPARRPSLTARFRRSPPHARQPRSRSPRLNRKCRRHPLRRPRLLA